MADLARAMTDEEMTQAAEYFGAIKWTPRVKVIETSLVPKTRIVGNLFLATEEARTEPIAGRLIEVPEEEKRSETLRDPRAGFIAYVPEGSLARGRVLVRLGGARMKTVVSKLTPDDITAIAAYVASKFPPDPADVEEGDAVRDEARLTATEGSR
jgi:hypothetical protein